MIRRFLSATFATLCTLGLLAQSASAQLLLTSINTVIGNSFVATSTGSFVDSYGNIYVANANGATVVEIPANGGAPITLGTGFVSIRGIVADSHGNVYIAQSNVTTIAKIPAGGGSPVQIGSGIGRPFMIAIDAQDSIYITDTNNSRIDKILYGQTTQTQFPVTIPTGSGAAIRGVAVDSKGYIYVSILNQAVTVTNPIVRLNPDGTGQVSLNITGIAGVQGIAVDSQSNLYVLDGTDGKLQEYKAPLVDAPGVNTPLTLATGTGASPVSVTVSPRGDIIYNNTKVFAIQTNAANFYSSPVLTASGAATLTFTSAAAETFTAPVFANGGSATALFKDAGGETAGCITGKSVAAGGTCTMNVSFTPQQVGISNGTVDVMDNSTPAVVLATVPLTGVGVAALASFAPGTASAFVSSLTQPAGLAADSGGNVYAVDMGAAKVSKVTSAGASSALAFTGLQRPVGVAVDGALNVYASDASNNAVYKLTALGVQTTVATSGLNAPKGIWLDGLNNLYIADSGNARVVKVDATGAQTALPLTGLAAPSWVAVDNAGNVYVSDSGNVYEYTIAGVQKTLATTGLTAPAGIAVGADGTVYAADSSNQNVYALLASGASFTLGGALGTPAGLLVAANGNLYVAGAANGQLTLIDRTKQTLTFPGTATGATSDPMTAVVQDTGNAVLQYSALSVSSGFAQVTPLAATDCSATSAVATGATCNVKITFSATAVGAASGTVTQTDNALGASTQTISLVATGIHDFTTTITQTTPAMGNPVYGGAVTLTATVAANVPGAPTPTGTVTFTVDGGQSMTQTLNGSAQATYSPTGLTAGTHTVVATYSGDADPAQYVITVASAVVTVTTAPQTRQYGQANAPFTPVYTGFIAPDTSAVVTGTPSFTTMAIATTDPGTIAINTDVTGLKAANYTFVAQNSSITITKATNTINFTPLPTSVVYGVLPLALTATSTLANGIVTFTVSGTTGATINGNSVVIGNIGQVTVTAKQAGNTDYASAPDVSQTFTVTPATLTLTADNKSKVQGTANPAFTFTASGFQYADSLTSGATSTVTSTSPLLSSTAGAGTGTGTYDITIAPGTPAFTAKNYNIMYVKGTLTITGNAAQTITFTPLSSIVYGAAAPSLSASTSAPGLSVTYTMIGSGASLSNGILTITGVGTVTITAHQAGNATYAAAADVSQSFTITPAVLTVTANPATRAYGVVDPPFSATVTGFVYSDTPASVYGTGQSSVTDPGVTITSDPGTYSLVPTQGNLVAANYTFKFVNGTLTITQAAQTISFTPTLGNVTYGQAPIPLTASTTAAGLSVTYTWTGGVSVSGTTLTITGVGAATVTAHQAGNTDFSPATNVTQSFTVSPAMLTVTANDASVAFGQPLPSFSSTYTGFKYSDTPSVVSGSPTYVASGTAPRDAGQYSITPSVGTLTAANYTFGPFVAGTLTVGTAAQTITFPALANVPQTAAATTTGTVQLNATSTSSLPITYTYTFSGAASGVSLTQPTGTTPGFVTYNNVPGVVTVTATQPGNNDFSAAIPVVQTFTILGSTTTAVTLSTPEANTGASVTLTATVTGKITGTMPTGTVIFYAGTVALNPGPATPAPSNCATQTGTLTCKATLSTALIPPGTIAITAVYSGDGTFSGSTSPAASILIIAGDFNVTATSTNLTMKAGDSASSVITLTPVGAYADTVKLSCSNLPANMYCTFLPVALNFYPPSGTTNTGVPQTTTVTITAKAQTTAALQQHMLRGEHSGVELAALIFGIPMAGLLLRRRKKLVSVGLLLLAAGMAIGVTGCGSSTTNLAAPGTYNIHVDMTDGSTIAHTLTITVTVQ